MMREVRVKVYDKCKYEKESIKVAEAEYKNVKKMQVVNMTDEEVYNDGFDDVDPYQEYCILTFEDGETATFRNSFVDVFVERTF